MSDTFGTPHATAGGPWAGPGADAVHEAYSFACLNCGYGWEQSYEIAQHVDEHGHATVVYYAGSQRVPSPLTRPTCDNCGGHLVRIMRSGRVSSARWDHLAYPARPAETGPGSPRTALSAAGSMMAAASRDTEGPITGTGTHPHREHHWLADFLAFFHRKPADDHDQAA